MYTKREIHRQRDCLAFNPANSRLNASTRNAPPISRRGVPNCGITGGTRQSFRPCPSIERRFPLPPPDSDQRVRTLDCARGSCGWCSPRSLTSTRPRRSLPQRGKRPQGCQRRGLGVRQRDLRSRMPHAHA